MEQSKYPETLNIRDEEALLILILFYMEKEYQNYELWNQFSHELIYNNRFHSSHMIVEEIKKRSEYATRIEKAGTVFFRARKYNREDYRQRFVDYVLKTTGKSKEEIDKINNDCPAYLRELLITPNLFSNEETEPDKWNSILKRALEKWDKNIRFKGYSGKDSTAPPTDKTPCGRANPANIRYLYLSEDKETPVYEMRPIIGQKLSIAKFRLKRDVKIYDLTSNPINSDPNDSEDISLFKTIGDMFSVPNDGQEYEYIPTQFLAEQIKRMGFDGLRFNSSLRRRGVNVVLFEPEDCTAISSDLVEVSDIKITSNPPDIYDISNYLE